jgi:hypothetical protein
MDERGTITIVKVIRRETGGFANAHQRHGLGTKPFAN